MDDLISRQAAIDALERKKDKNSKGDIGGFYNKIIQNDIDTLMHLPSIQADRKQIIRRNLCDSCINNGCIFQSGIVRNHCDFYKADMRGEQDET